MSPNPSSGVTRVGDVTRGC